jgi:hypothetical protein
LRLLFTTVTLSCYYYYDLFFILLSKSQITKNQVNGSSNKAKFSDTMAVRRPVGIRHPARCSADAQAGAKKRQEVGKFWRREMKDSFRSYCHFSQLDWTALDRDRKISIARIKNNNNFDVQVYAYIHENNQRHDYIYLIVLDVYCLDDVIGSPSPPAHSARIYQQVELKCVVGPRPRGGGECTSCREHDNCSDTHERECNSKFYI